LAEVGNLASYNEDVRFLLVVIDVVSKFTFVEPLKTKRAEEVRNAFVKIFSESSRKPKKLQTDDGKEFVNRQLGELCRKEGIIFFTVKSDKKAAVAERVIRTLKEKMYRYMHEMQTDTYIDVLKDLVTSYNNTYHKSIKMAPAEVTEDNEGQVLKNLYGKAWEADKKQKKPKFKEGDFVRISMLKHVFEKGYTGNWSQEVFIVDKVKLAAVPQIMYKLRDWGAEPLTGSFYDKELQLVSKGLEDYWKVEKTIDKKMVRGKLMHLVKWQGHPSSLNSWVLATNIKKIGTNRGVSVGDDAETGG
jgi:hypothetical protein